MDNLEGMEQTVYGWIIKTARKNIWRVNAWYDLEDLIQDGVMWYYMTEKRYSKTVKSRSHMMALFKTSFQNYIHDLANPKRQRTPNEVTFSDLDGGGDGDLSVEDLVDIRAYRAFSIGVASVDVGIVLVDAPERVRAALELLLSDEGAKKLRSAYRVRGANQVNNDKVERARSVRVRVLCVRETLNERLCRLLGYDPKTVNITKEIREYLSGDGEQSNARI